ETQFQFRAVRICGLTNGAVTHVALLMEVANMRNVRSMLATIACVLLLMAGPDTANSITVVVGPWQITLTDLGVLPGGTASRGPAINNANMIVGSAIDTTLYIQ